MKKPNKCTRCRRRPIIWRAADGRWYASCCDPDLGQETTNMGTRKRVEALWNYDMQTRAHNNKRKHNRHKAARAEAAT